MLLSNSRKLTTDTRLVMNIFPKILATTALCLAAVGACPLCAAEPASPSLVGKVLVLKIKDAEKRYAFSDSHVVRKTFPLSSFTEGTNRQVWKESYYVYSPETAEFYEENRINSTSGKVRDGYGWRSKFFSVKSLSSEQSTLANQVKQRWIHGIEAQLLSAPQPSGEASLV